MNAQRNILGSFITEVLRWDTGRRDHVDLRCRSVVFAPHPDDETLGCGGTIARMTDLGTKLAVVFLTDGSASCGARMSGPELAALRREEAIEALKRLGVPSADVHFIDAPDGALVSQRARVCRLVKELLDEYQPEQIFLPYHREPPEDHKVAHHIVKEAASQASQPMLLYGYPIWFWYRWPFTPASLSPNQDSFPRQLFSAVQGVRGVLFELRCQVSVSSVLGRKRYALEAHETQVKRYDGSDNWPILADVADGKWLDNILTSYELFHRTRVGYSLFGSRLPADEKVKGYHATRERVAQTRWMQCDWQEKK